MVVPPTWTYDLSPTARWLCAYGLPSQLDAPNTALTHEQYRSVKEECSQHGLTGLLIRAIADEELLVDADSRADAGQLELDLVRGRIDYEKRVALPMAILDSAGVEFRVLKGLAVARLEYPDEIMRTTSDFDLAIRADQLDDAVAALVGAGGKWNDPEPTAGWMRHVGKGATVYLPETSMEIDLHRLLVWGPFGVRLPEDALWGTPREVTIANRICKTLAREETLLHACVHQSVLGVVRAREARDVAQMLIHRDLDVERLLQLSKAWGVETLLAMSIHCAHQYLALESGSHPLEHWAEAHRATLRERLWLRTASPDPQQRIHGVEQAAVLVELGFGRQPDRWRARRILLRANFAPDKGTYASPSTRLAKLARRIAKK